MQSSSVHMNTLRRFQRGHVPIQPPYTHVRTCTHTHPPHTSGPLISTLSLHSLYKYPCGSHWGRLLRAPAPFPLKQDSLARQGHAAGQGMGGRSMHRYKRQTLHPSSGSLFRAIIASERLFLLNSPASVIPPGGDGESAPLKVQVCAKVSLSLRIFSPLAWRRLYLFFLQPEADPQHQSTA